MAKLQEAQHKSEAKLKSTGRLTNLNGRPGKWDFFQGLYSDRNTIAG